MAATMIHEPTQHRHAYHHHRRFQLNSLLRHLPGHNSNGDHSRSYISPPYFPMRPHSVIAPLSPRRISSRSSTDSSSSMSEDEREMGSYDLRGRAVSLISELCGNDKGRQGQREGQWEVEDLISEELSVQPLNVVDGEEASPEVMTRAAALERWERLRREKERMGYEMRVKEAVVDEGQRKVWVYSEILQRGNEEEEMELSLVKERIDMLSFDWEGRMCGTLGWFRRRKSVVREDD